MHKNDPQWLRYMERLSEYKKFIARFQHLENQAKKLGKTLHEMSLEEMDVYWDEAKKEHK